MLKKVLLVISIFFVSAFTFTDVKAAASPRTETTTILEKETDLITFAQKIKSWSENSHTPLGAFHKKDLSGNFRPPTGHSPTSPQLYSRCQSLARSFSARSLLYRLMLFPKHYFW